MTLLRSTLWGLCNTLPLLKSSSDEIGRRWPERGTRYAFDGDVIPRKNLALNPAEGQRGQLAFFGASLPLCPVNRDFKLALSQAGMIAIS